MQKARKNISNWKNGVYPLYKNLFGIIEDDRIIDIDHGVGCGPEDLTNKRMTKRHPFSVSSSSYKMRSGM
ncbi:hypothetical protein INT48_005988 [Thamnidium elegans]|uniref:Uncharacterized protein n=1 Tax=Thamnidium elegans TaxID=101142 RepID=A0A8H7VZ99_9FUNG|nr:hypothetical protein INT48_005988 [Thamnidium elegans]